MFGVGGLAVGHRRGIIKPSYYVYGVVVWVLGCWALGVGHWGLG